MLASLIEYRTGLWTLNSNIGGNDIIHNWNGLLMPWSYKFAIRLKMLLELCEQSRFVSVSSRIAFGTDPSKQVGACRQ